MKKILAIVAVAVMVAMSASAGDRPFAVVKTIAATNLTFSYTNTYTGTTASDNLAVMVPKGPVVIKFTGATFTNPVVTLTRTSGTLSYTPLVVTCASNTTTIYTNIPAYVWKTGDILGIQVSPQHTNTTAVEITYE
jgi:hypothetical protein